MKLALLLVFPAYVPISTVLSECILYQVKRPRLSLLQSQTLRAANYTAGIADIASESDVDLPEVKQLPAKAYFQTKTACRIRHTM